MSCASFRALHCKRLILVHDPDNRFRACRVMAWRWRYGRYVAKRSKAASGRTNVRFSYIGLYKVE